LFAKFTYSRLHDPVRRYPTRFQCGAHTL
jgi:hypothetical protein